MSFFNKKIDIGLSNLVPGFGFLFMLAPYGVYLIKNENPDIIRSGQLRLIATSLMVQSSEKLPGSEKISEAAAQPFTAAA